MRTERYCSVSMTENLHFFFSVVKMSSFSSRSSVYSAVILWLSYVLLFIAILHIRFLWKLFTKNQPSATPISLFFKCMVSVIVIFSFCSTLWDVLHIRYAYHDGGFDTDAQADVKVAADACYFTASIALYILLIAKLYWTFREGKYRLSRKYMYFLTLLQLIQLALMILYIVNFEDVNILYLCVIDLVIDASILGLFIYKLKQLLVDSVHLELLMNSVHLEYPIDCQNQQELIMLIRKQFVLGTWMILFSCTFFGSMLIMNGIWKFISVHFPMDGFFLIAYSLRAVENLVITCLLYLTFEFNEKHYRRVCGCCDNGCYECWLSITNRGSTKRQAVVSLGVYYKLES